jgi:hypothetical protein
MGPPDVRTQLPVQEAIAPRRILVLYWTPLAPSRIRSAIRHHLEAMTSGPSSHHVTYWNAFDGAGMLVRRGRYDAVILHTTLLCLRWFESFPEWTHKLRWLADLDCLKIAVPQDEYNHFEVLDEWLTDLNVDHVLTNYGPELRLRLYPRLSQRAQFQPVFTGYIDEKVAKRLESRLVATGDRPLDVVYRATHLPYWYGHLGQLKHLVGERARLQAKAHGLKADISTQTEDAVLGDEWFDFLAAGRVVVGSESGSGVLDARGEVQASIRAYLKESPSATFEEVAAQMPKAWDSDRMGVIGPRHFEAVITKTCQVLVSGTYDGVLVAGRHYVPVRPDLTDLGDALQAASDPGAASEMAERTYEEIYRSGGYTYRVLAEKVDRVLATRPPRPGTAGTGQPALARLGSWRLNRPYRTDSGLTLVRLDAAAGLGPPAPPWIQLARSVLRRSERGMVIGAVSGRVSRALLGTYLHAGEAASSIPAGRLLAESRLLDRMSRAQAAQPRTPSFRVIKASDRGSTLELSVLRKAPQGHGSPAEPSWPPRSIVVGLPSYGGLTAKVGDQGLRSEVRLDAVAALTAIRPVPVHAALHTLLDSIGGAKARPRNHGARGRLGTLLATTRLMFAQPENLWLLLTAVGRAPLGDTADDLLKLALLRGVKRDGAMASRIEPGTRTLCLVTEPAGEIGADSQGRPGEEIERIVWDNSAVSSSVSAPVAMGRRVVVFLGAGGVHEFTALQALPSSARKAILRQLGA